MNPAEFGYRTVRRFRLAPTLLGSALIGLAVAVSPVAAQSADATIANFAFSPEPISVAAGATVNWTNTDAFEHTVTAVGGSFDSGLIGAGASFGLTFNDPGTYEYFCALHDFMKGTVVVS
ncbi:MAG: hypothetical protein QOF51_3778 [Chloroflexota bacterium]|jgi:plastocyanin|nr:hypothetical protein [Chloroflexota bacterium]